MPSFWSLSFWMGALRLFSGCLEITAGLIMISRQSVEVALKINALLSLVGPIIMITVTSLGLVGIAGQVSLDKMLLILTGVILIFFGLNKI